MTDNPTQTEPIEPQNVDRDAGTSLLRWRVSRIYEDSPTASGGERTVHVDVHHSTDELMRRVAKHGAARLRHEAAESRDWWDRRARVEGWISEATLISQLARYPAGELGDLLAGPDERQLAEDIVLLQTLESPDAWATATDLYREGAEDFLDLTPLATVSGSRWLDITRQARRASKQRYRRALREGEQRRISGAGKGDPRAS